MNPDPRVKLIKKKKSRAPLIPPLVQSSAVENKWSTEDTKALFQQPTAEEVSRLIFAELRDIRVHAQEARNHFAHLLNRGSPLE